MQKNILFLSLVHVLFQTFVGCTPKVDTTEETKHLTVEEASPAGDIVGEFGYTLVEATDYPGNDDFEPFTRISFLEPTGAEVAIYIFQDDHTLRQVDFSWMNDGKQIFAGCDAVPAEGSPIPACEGVTIDYENKTVAFSNTALSGNDASAVLDGEASFAETAAAE
jgi:hypothetical protein